MANPNIIKNSIKKIAFLSLSAVFFIIYNCKKKGEIEDEILKNNSLSICNCTAPFKNTYIDFAISHVNDSLVILCKDEKINGQNWNEFLKKHTFYSTPNQIIDCNKNEPIEPKFSSVKVGLNENNQLVLYSYEDFPYYDESINNFSPRSISVYKEIISVKANQLSKSLPEFIFTPPKYSQKAINEVNKLIKLKEERPKTFYIKKHLLVGALNGHRRSIEILKNFEDYFPNDMENPNQEISILKDFEDYIKNGGKIEYFKIPNIEDKKSK